MIRLHDKTYTCPIDVALSLLNGKWKILIIARLHRFAGNGFSELREQLPGVSEKMLHQQLLELERDGLIKKTVLSEKPYRVSYSLAPRGTTIAPLTEQLSQWGIDYLKEQGIDYLKDQELYK